MGARYRIALVGQIDYATSCQAWDTYESLKLAGHAVEVLDPRLLPGVLTPDEQVNHKMLERFTEVFKPDVIATTSEHPASILSKASLARSTAATQTTGTEEPTQSDEPARHFVVFGYIGKDNLGDELIFSIIHRQICAHYPGAWVSVIGHCPPATLARHGVASVEPTAKAQVDMMLNGASALVFMAGIMFDGPFESWTSGKIDLFQNPHSEIAGQTAMAQLAYMNGVPSVFLGIGAGPLQNPDAQKLLQLTALTGAQFITRDAKTVQLLEKARVPQAQVTQKADLAFLTQPPAQDAAAAAQWLHAHALEPGTYSVVSLCQTGLDASAKANIAALLDAQIEQGHAIVFANFAPEDAQIHNAVQAKMAHGNAALHFGLATGTNGALTLIAQATRVFAMRLHCSILANALGTQSIGLNYNDKVEAFYAQMGRSNYLLDLNFSVAEGCAVFELATTQAQADLALIAQGAARNRELASDTFGILWSIVDGSSARPHKQVRYCRTQAPDALKVEQLEAQLERANQQVESLKAQLNSVKSSTTWKCGQAVTALPRGLKRAAARKQK